MNFGRIHKRLLHIAIDVADIAGQVALSVEPLRIVDPSGYLIDRLCRATKQYLDSWRRGWKSQFMSFYLNLVREPQFGEEFIRLGQLTFDLSDVIYFTELPESWQADPIEALHDPVTMSSKCGSTLDILANFFESAEDFIVEYRRHLADALLRAGPAADINELVPLAAFICPSFKVTLHRLQSLKCSRLRSLLPPGAPVK